jgi:hypothetical protein
VHHHVFLFFAWPKCIVMCFCSLINLNASLGVSIPCLAWMHCWVFLFLVQLEGIIECFCSLFDLIASLGGFFHFFNVNALLCVFIPCSIWMHRQMFLFFFGLQWMTMCSCSFFGLSASPCVFCSLLDFNALPCVSIPCSTLKTLKLQLLVWWQNPQKGWCF